MKKTMNEVGTECSPTLNTSMDYACILYHIGSSGGVDSMFSAINLNKNKMINKLDTKTLSDQLKTKNVLTKQNKPYFYFTINCALLDKQRYYI